MAKYYIWGGTKWNEPDLPDDFWQGLPVEMLRVYMMHRPITDNTQEWIRNSAMVTANTVANEVGTSGNNSVILNGHIRALTIGDREFVPMTSEWRDLWESWFELFTVALKSKVDRMDALIFDHARYPNRRKTDEKQWMESLLDKVRTHEGIGSVGMYGVPSGVAYWTPFESPDPEFEVRDQMPWLIAPDQWRPKNGNATNAEFAWSLAETVHVRGHSRVVVWCDTKNMSRRQWDTMAALIAANENKDVDRVADRKPADLSWIPDQVGKVENFESILKNLLS